MLFCFSVCKGMVCRESVNQTFYLLVLNRDSSVMVWGQNCSPTSGSSTMTTCPHTQRFLWRSFWRRKSVMILQHHSHSPDLAPCDFFLFSTMENNLNDHTLKPRRRFRRLWRRFYIICRRMASDNASTVRNNTGIRVYLKEGITLTEATALHCYLWLQSLLFNSQTS
jgi:hypothetical protein